MRCQVKRYVPHWVDGGGYTCARLTSDIRLQFSSKYPVHKAVALGQAGDRWCLPPRLFVQHVQYGDEELVGVLLLITGQVTGMCPYKEEQLEWVVR